MKNVLIVLFIILFSFFVIRRVNRTPIDTSVNQAGNQASSSPKYESELPTSNLTRYGVMLSGRNISETDSITIAKNLGVTVFRPNAIRMDTWNGVCGMCDKIIAASLKPLPSISNSGGAGLASAPPTDIAKYKTALTQILQKYPFEVVVVENEENSELFYTGTPQQYGAELKAACEVSHSLKLRCANGGLVSKLAALLVYDNYLSQGDSAKAQNFADRVFTPQEQQALKGPKVADQIQKGKQLLAEYKKSGADYVNFHWYIDDTRALKETVNFLYEQTGLTVITNEIGQQKNEDPNQVTRLLTTTQEMKLPLVVWFSIDIAGYAQARALTDEKGNLRPNGEAFKEFLKIVNQ